MKAATLATAVAVAALTVAGAAGAVGVAGHRDTASAAESVDTVVTTAQRALPSSARDVHGKPGGELLSVDLRGDGSAQVMLYDYATGLTHQVSVDAGRVRADQEAAGMQPPASSDEVAAAFGIAVRAPHPLLFAATFAEQQGVPLVSADQVNLAAEAWTARDGSHAATVCATHRCVQLVVATAAGEYLDTSDFVVDLSAGRVLRLKDEP